MYKELEEKANKHYNRHLPLVLYRKPEASEVRAIFQKDDQLRYITDYKEAGFVFAPFDTAAKSILLVPDEVVNCEYHGLPRADFRHKLLPSTENDKSKHLGLVEKGLDQIRKGPLRKVVLSRKVDIKGGHNPFELFRALLSLYPKTLCYLWYHPKVGLWLGATPETLLIIENNALTTMALAGTQKVRDGVAPDWGNKEKQEQAMVTEYITAALNKKIDNIETSEPISVKAGNLWHLKTTISGTLKTPLLKTIIKVLHPTPAVCGLPLQEALACINSHEGYDREYYTGFLGELNLEGRKDAHFFVNLRCLQMKQDIATIYVGGGITLDSKPEQEWQETVDKTATMVRVLFNSSE